MSARFFLPTLLGTIALAVSVEERLGDAIGIQLSSGDSR